MKRAFTIEQDKEIAEQYQAGMSSIKLAKKYEVDKSTILGALKRQRAEMRNNRAFTDSEEQQIAHIYLAGHSITNIAKAYGYDFTTIKSALKRQGVKDGDDRFRFDDRQEKKILEHYESGSTTIELANQHNAAQRTITNAIINQGGEIRDGRIFTDSEEVMIAHIYEAGHSPQKIADIYGVSKKAITNALKRQEIDRRPNRTHFFNECAFDDLNDEHALYWLGFCYADGNVTDYELRIGLAFKDITHLELLKLFMQSNNEVAIRNNSTSCHIGFANIKLVKRLKSLGFVPRRNNFHKLKPHISQGLEHHFILGYLDGDGCISTNEQVVFLGQPDVLTWIRDTLNKAVGASKNTIRQRRGICEVSWGGIRQARRIVDYLYQDATVYLERKKKIADNWRKK